MLGAFAASTLWAVYHLLSLSTRQLDFPTEVFCHVSEVTMIDIALANFDPRSALILLALEGLPRGNLDS